MNDVDEKTERKKTASIYLSVKTCPVM